MVHNGKSILDHWVIVRIWSAEKRKKRKHPITLPYEKTQIAIQQQQQKKIFFDFWSKIVLNCSHHNEIVPNTHIFNTNS